MKVQVLTLKSQAISVTSALLDLEGIQNKGSQRSLMKLEKLVYYYYNTKLRLRDKRAKDNVINENNYIDLLHVASEPLQNDIDPLHNWIISAHLDDGNDNRLPHVA